MFSLKNILFALVSGTKREKSVLYTCTRARSEREKKKKEKEIEIDRWKRERERGKEREEAMFSRMVPERRKEKEFLTVSCTHLRPDAAPTPG